MWLKNGRRDKRATRVISGYSEDKCILWVRLYELMETTEMPEFHFHDLQNRNSIAHLFGLWYME